MVSVCSLFWDLYSAAPERRDTCEASQEAKAFHEYVSSPSLKKSENHNFSLFLGF